MKVSPERYHLRQERYLTNPSAKDEGEQSPCDYKWDVPITYFTDLQPKKVERTWLMRGDGYLELNVPAGN